MVTAFVHRLHKRWEVEVYGVLGDRGRKEDLLGVSMRQEAYLSAAH